jgi:hypothetical protein
MLRCREIITKITSGDEILDIEEGAQEPFKFTKLRAYKSLNLLLKRRENFSEG